MNLINKSFTKLFIFTLVIAIGIISLSSKSSSVSGEISAVLQTELDLSNPASNIIAVSTSDQQLSDGSSIPRGSKLLGTTSVDGNNIIILFNSVETLDGQTQKITGKLIISKSASKERSGVSAKLGKTLHNQAKSNVIGAIFYNPGTAKDGDISILPKGSILKIEVD